MKHFLVTFDEEQGRFFVTVVDEEYVAEYDTKVIPDNEIVFDSLPCEADIYEYFNNEHNGDGLGGYNHFNIWYSWECFN